MKNHGTLIGEGNSGFYGKEIGQFSRTYSIKVNMIKIKFVNLETFESFTSKASCLNIENFVEKELFLLKQLTNCDHAAIY